MGSMDIERRVYTPPLDDPPEFSMPGYGAAKYAEHGYGASDYAVHGHDLDSRRGEGGRRVMIGVIMVGVVAAVGGVGWNIYARSGEPPVIAGDKGNFKTYAAAPAGDSAADHEVYGVIDGAAPSPATFARTSQDVVPLTTVAAVAGPAKPEPLDLRPPAGAMAPAAAPGAAPASLFGKPEIAAQGAFMVQLAALRTEEAAREAWEVFGARAPGLARDARMDIQRADLGAQGIFYRLRAGYFVDRERAQTFCERAKGAGQDCMVVAR